MRRVAAYSLARRARKARAATSPGLLALGGRGRTGRRQQPVARRPDAVLEGACFGVELSTLGLDGLRSWEVVSSRLALRVRLPGRCA